MLFVFSFHLLINIVTSAYANGVDVIELTCTLATGTSLGDEGGITTLFNSQKHIPISVSLHGDRLKNSVFLSRGFESKIDFEIINENNNNSYKLLFIASGISSYMAGEIISYGGDNIYRVNEDIIKQKEGDTYSILEYAGSVNINGVLMKRDKSDFAPGKYKIIITLSNNFVYNDYPLKSLWNGRINYNTKYIVFRIIVPKTDYEKRTAKYIKAMDYENANELVLAEKELKALLKKWPDQIQFYYSLAIIQYKLGKCEESRESLKKIMKGVIENYFSVIDRISACYIAEGDYENARKTLKEYYKDDKVVEEKIITFEKGFKKQKGDTSIYSMKTACIYWYDKLPLAAKYGDKYLAQRLISDGAGINAADADGWAALHWAAMRGDKDLTSLLIEHGAVVNMGCNGGWTPQHVAALHGRLEVVRLLIASGAQIDATDRDGATPLHRAAAGGHRDVAEFLIEHGADVTKEDRFQLTALHYAAESGSDGAAEVAELLIADLVGKNNALFSLLYSSIIRNKTDFMKFLIENGVDVDEANEYGQTLLFIAVTNDRIDIAGMLIAAGADVDSRTDEQEDAPLWAAVSYGRMNFVKLLLEHGADANIAKKNGYPLTHMAIGKEKTDIVELLIKYGADIEAVDNNGDTLLLEAVRLKSVGLVKLFLERGADPNKDNYHGITPLYEAVGNCCSELDEYEEIARLLIAYGADVNYINQYGTRPLQEAVRALDKDVIKMLIEHGADVNADRSAGWTPLMLAVNLGDEGIVRLLLECGAKNHLMAAVMLDDKAMVEDLIERGHDVNYKHVNGYPLLYYAILLGHMDIAELLIEHGADVNAKNDFGETLLGMAKRVGSKSFEELLRKHGAE